jgi:energy-converting hydrogenase Eha subunit H
MNTFQILLLVIILMLFITPDFMNTDKYVKINKVKSPMKSIYYP